MDFHNLFPPGFQCKHSAFTWGKILVFLLSNFKIIIIICGMKINLNVFLKLSL